jgi:hypothetical protein
VSMNKEMWASFSRTPYSGSAAGGASLSAHHHTESVPPSCETSIHYGRLDALIAQHRDVWPRPTRIILTGEVLISATA